MPYLKCCRRHNSTIFLGVFMCCCQLRKDLFSICMIWKDFWSFGCWHLPAPCQSIGWLSGIDRCAERSTSLILFKQCNVSGQWNTVLLLDLCAFLMFAGSLPQLWPMLCIFPLFIFPNLVLLLQHLSSFLHAIRLQWLTIKLTRYGLLWLSISLV